MDFLSQLPTFSVGTILLLFTWFGVPALYQIFVARRVDLIRDSLAKQRSGRLRRRYVRLFVEAVRGEAKVTDARSIQQLLRLEPMGIMILGIIFVVSVNKFDRAIADSLSIIKEQKNTVANRIDRLDQPESNLETETESRRIELQDLSDSISENERRALTLKRQVPIWWTVAIAMFVFGFLWSIWHNMFVSPMIQFRNRFAHELERFTMRIQGLASKSELADLTRKEARVVDEESARAYVDMMAQIAKRHGIEELVQSFLLWGPADTAENVT